MTANSDDGLQRRQPDPAPALSGGEAVLFDGNAYHQPNTEWPFLGPELLSDDDLHELRTGQWEGGRPL